jgi:hypothetical protein
VPDRRARWWFAAGCARTAVFPPRGHRVSVLAVAALATAAVAATWLAVGHALPTMQGFAVMFAAFVGAMATVAVARSRRLHRPAHGPLITITGLVGVAACVAATGYSLGADGSATLESSPAIALAVMLAGCLWLTLAPPRALTTSRLARRAGVGVALAFGAGVFLATRLNETNGEGIVGYLLSAPVFVFFIASALVAAIDRSFLAGVQTAVWAVVVTCLLTFAVFVVEALRWYHIHQTSLLDGDNNGQYIESAISWILIALPLWTLPFGIIGAALGAIGSNARDATGPSPAPVASPPTP